MELERDVVHLVGIDELDVQFGILAEETHHAEIEAVGVADGYGVGGAQFFALGRV